MSKKIWKITGAESNFNYGIYSSKAKALDAIVLWADNGQNSYTVDTDIDKIKVLDGIPDMVNLTTSSGKFVALWVCYAFINNGANLILMGSKEGLS